jgi:hypothetical protein
VGKDTLKDTDEDMKRVAVLASELGRENGVVGLFDASQQHHVELICVERSS